MAKVVVDKVTKNFGTSKVIEGLSLSVTDGEFVVLVGPSGCGKTTLLRMIAGLETVSAGQIFIGDRDVTWMAPKDRDIAMVFQSYALYPHMSAAENMSFGLRLNKTPPEEVKSRVAHAARMLKIEHLLDRRPRELSGGQRQRVAMGRAIVRKPALYLFDEPLSNLDAKLRTSMRAEIKRMHLHEKKTVVYVTHDQIEALTLADRIVAMDKGEIQQIGTPDELYNRPSSLFVASFIGSPGMSLLPGILDSQDGKPAVRLKEGASQPIVLPSSWDGVPSKYRNTSVLLGVRPEAFAYDPQRTATGIDLKVNVVEPCGAEAYVLGDIAGQEVTARCIPTKVPKLDEVARFNIDTAQIHLFDPSTTRSLRP